MSHISIDTSQLIKLREDGYLILDNFLSNHEIEIFKAGLIRATYEGGKDLSIEPTFDRLITDERFAKIATLVLGSRPLYHHANGRAFSSYVPGKIWHHDFDGQASPTSRLSMMHILIYPEGISVDSGGLSVLPGSHLVDVERSTPNTHRLERIDGEVLVQGGRGVAVVIFSALWHVRRPAKLSPNSHRLDFNVSYCVDSIKRPERESYAARMERIRKRIGNHNLLMQ